MNTTADGTLVVGAGAMGLPILRCLVNGGFRVTCVDPSATARADAAQAGAATSPDIQSVAASHLVTLLFVPSDRDVLDAVTAYADRAPDTATIVICSSVTRQTCQQAEALAAPNGIGVVDAALTGGVRAAETGTINLLVGGDTGTVAALRPTFEEFTAHVHHMGPLGSGQIAKTVNNLIHWGEIITIIEALSFAHRHGISPTAMRQALATGPTDGRTLRELELMKFRWYGKDLSNAEKMAAEVHLDLPVARLAHTLMRDITPETVEHLFKR